MKDKLKALLEKFQQFIEKSNVSGIIIAMISFLIIVLFSLTEAYNTFENRLYDLRFQLKPSIKELDALVFADIDENSINNVGKFPWPRHLYASGLEIMKQVGVRQAAFDIEFPDKSPQIVNFAMHVQLKDKARRGKVSPDELDRVILDNDEILADGISLMHKVILPYHFQKELLVYQDYDEAYKRELSEAKAIFLEKATVKVPKAEWNKYKDMVDPERVGVATPIPELVRSAYSFGFVDRDPDSDGIERRIRLVRFFQGRLYFEMALVMLMDICGVKKEDVVVNPGKNIILKGAVNPVNYVKDDIVIPINDKGMIYINWAGPGRLEASFTHIPFYAFFEYPRVRNEVYDFFDEEELNSGKRVRSKLYGELAEHESVFYSTDDLSVKREKSEIIKDLYKRIREIEWGYTKPIRDDIEKIKEDLKKAEEPAPQLEQILAQYNNYLNAVKLVHRVEALRNKYVITGLTATGTHDLGAIPIYSEYMMVGTYHNIINTVLNDEFILKTGSTANYIIMFILAVVMGVIVQHLGARMSIVAIIAALSLVNFVNFSFFAYLNRWFDMVGQNMAIFLPSAVIAGVKLMKEESQKRYIKSAFSRYLSPGVIDQIIESPEALELGGEARIITIFFSDVAKFSTISEKLSPPELVQLLNEYLSEMTDIIMGSGGTVDKYEGDAIMAFWGAPQAYEDHARRCVFASIDMKRRLREMQEVWRSQGRDELTVRMGINSGEAVVGNMGSSARMDYTAMGDSVNLASRLEGANKFYKTGAMISGSTYNMVKDDVEARYLDTIRVVGKDEPIKIYELLNRKGRLRDRMYDMMEHYYKGIEYFENRAWKDSLEYFQKAAKIIKDDGPTLTYIERCESYIKKPPPKKWDGVYKLTSK